MAAADRKKAIAKTAAHMPEFQTITGQKSIEETQWMYQELFVGYQEF